MQPSIQELRENLVYVPLGHLYWRKPGLARQMGRPVGHVCKSGYRSIRLNGNPYRAHKVIWALQHGVWPIGDIDHINGCRDDNRIDNLREATRSQNLANSKQRSENLKGAHFDKRRQTWSARITINYKEIWLGTYASEAEAHAAYLKAAQKYFGEFARAA